jgi:hypothetical protein
MRGGRGLGAFVAATVLAAGAGCANERPSSTGESPATPRATITAPMTGDDGRPFIEVTVTTKSGREPVRAFFLLDTGGGAVLVAPRTARRLGLALDDTAKTYEGTFAHVPDAEVTVDGHVVTSTFRTVVPTLDAGGAPVTSNIDGMLPRGVLRQFDVVFDFPGRLVTLAPRASLPPTGERVGVTVEESGFLNTEADMDGVQVPLLVDSGSTATCADGAILDALAGRHPEWARPTPHTKGLCAGAATPLRLPDVVWGGVHLGPQDVYPLSGPSTGPGPRRGLLGASALQAFRTQIDYAGQAIYLVRAGSS